MKPAGGRGKKVYEGGEGAPRLVVRLDPDVLAWLRQRPEGVRSWVESSARLQMGTPSDGEQQVAEG